LLFHLQINADGNFPWKGIFFPELGENWNGGGLLNNQKLLLLILNQRLRDSQLITEEEFDIMKVGIIAMKAENTSTSQQERKVV